MGKGGDATTAPVKKEVLIDGVFYDVTNLKHPGGSVIDYYAGQNVDATQPFYQFHIRSKSATKYLKSLPSRTADADVIKKANPLKGQEQLMKDFDEFTRQLEKEGYFKPSLPHVFYRTSEIIAIYGAGLYFLLHGQMILGILLMALGQGRCGWYMHEGGHYSLTGNVNIDVVLQMLFYGIGCGMSGSWWRIQHNKHHSTPQHLGYDVDLNTLPLVAFTDKVLKKVKGFQKFWIGSQSLLFPLIINLLVALGWQFYLHPRHILRRKLWIEAASCIARYVLWTVFITSKFGLWQSTLIYLAYDWVAANYIFLNFAVSHTHLDVIEKEDRSVDWVRYGAIYSMNVHPGPFKFINWWMGYLNFQIEHHLFPCMPQYRHPQISPRVKEFFEKHGLKYDQRSYFEALRVTFKNLHKVGIDAFYG